MKKSYLSLITCFVIISTLFITCTRESTFEPDDIKPLPQAQTEQNISDGDMVLGEKLTNPYSLAIMQQAYSELAPTRSDITLEPTDLYVRFLPKDSADVSTLEDRYNLELFGYPLDYDIQIEGTTYHDPLIPADQITWQYTTVKPDFSFPDNIRYEILEYCYIPDEDDEDEDESGEIATRNPSFNNQLELKAFEISQLPDKFRPTESETKGLFGKSVRPTGTITMYDDILKKNVGVKGVKIRCHILVKWSTTYTNENGYYSMDSKFSARPHYAIVFDNSKGFDIYGNWGPLAKANYNMGWRAKEGHSRDIQKNTVAWDWCAVNNAGYDYYKMCEKEGITKPPASLKVWVFPHKSNVTSAPMLNKVSHVYGFKSNSKLGNFFNTYGLNIPTAEFLRWFKPLMPDITVGSKRSDLRSIYGSVNHEFAHASHFSKVGSAFWADYISYIITYGSYGSPSSFNSGLCGVGEMWGYAIGNIQEFEKYGPDNQDIKNTTLVGAKQPYPGGKWWFKPQILWDLYRDNILTKKQMYDCLTSEVRDHMALKDKMVSRHSKLKDDINMAFLRHDFYKYKSEWVVKNNSDRTLIVETTNNGIAVKKDTLNIGAEYIFAALPECSAFNGFKKNKYTLADVIRVRRFDNNALLKIWSETQASAADKQFFKEGSWVKTTSKGQQGTNSKWTFTINTNDL